MRRVVVLAKPPLRGRCKSRLAADVGEGRATRLARAMLRDTWRLVRRVTDDDPTVEARLAVAGTRDEYPLLVPDPRCVPQGDGDLGRRMARLIRGALDAGHVDRVLLLGTDSPHLPAAHVRAALDALERHDVVLGEGADGGFWCLGARASAAAARRDDWLDGVDWSVDATAAPVRARAAALGLDVGEAPRGFDVDRGDDLGALRRALRESPDAAPAVRAELETPGDPLSVVVAHLDEGMLLDRCLDALAQQPGPLEVVVADGSSRDGSALRAAHRTDVTVCVTEPGRGRQLAAGARHATGDRILFLHVDVRLPEGGTRLVHEALDAGAEAGAFVTRTRPEAGLRNRAGPLLRLADVRSRVTRHPYGDQALFVTRAAYEAVGGFRDLPILEDYDLSRRLAARRPLARVRTPVTVSGRRLQEHPLRAALLMRLLPPLFRMGVDPHRLARLYRA